MMQSPDKAIRRATMVAKGLAKEIGPLPTGDHPKPPHPASMIPGVHVTGMGDEHTAIPDGYADGGDVTSNPNFSQWFGNSVTHDNGVPRTYYTGTSKDKDFTSFNVGRHGAWFTTDPHEASQYAESNDSQGHVWENGRFQRTNTASRVIPAYLKAENPYTGERPEAYSLAQNYKKAQSDWFDQLRAAGHDAWIPSSLKGNLAVMLRHPTQIKSAIGNSGAFDPKQKAIHKADGGDVEPTDETGFDAWHGTPHMFAPEPGAPLGRFRSDKIGTGEGAQAFGHGMYVGQEGTARGYKNTLRSRAVDPEYMSGVRRALASFDQNKQEAYDDNLIRALTSDDSIELPKAPMSSDALPNFQAAARIFSAHDTNEPAIKVAQNIQAQFPHLRDEGSFLKHGPKRLAIADQVEKMRERTKGHLLHVRVNANPEHFLDWDKPLSEQHPRVQSALAGVTDLESIKFGGDAYQALANQMADKKGRGNFAGASAALHAAGIPGIRYLDANSRDPDTDQPTHNHVIFDPSIIDIKHRYARGGAVDDLARRLTTHRNVLSGMDHKAQYAAIDGIMRDVSKHHDIMPNKLHDDWVARHRQTPDDWINSNVRGMPGLRDSGKHGYATDDAVDHALRIVNGHYSNGGAPVNYRTMFAPQQAPQMTDQAGFTEHAGPVSIGSLSAAFDKAIAHHLSLSPEERIANRKRADAALAPHVGMKKDGKVVPLLGKNAKMMKAETGYKGGEPVLLPDGRGIETTGLALAPSYQEGQFNTCPNSQSCKAECLGKTSGNYFKVGGGSDLSAFEGPRLNSLKKTLAMMRQPEAFAVRLHDEIAAAKREAEANGNILGVRLNVLSDINPRVHKSIIEAHPDVAFYDYTKNNSNPIAPNHHYTYSSTGLTQPEGVNGNPNATVNRFQNWKQMRKRLDGGDNVAMAFSHKRLLPETVHDEETGKIYRVVNGDTHDFRPMDMQPPGADGVIVGLKNKKSTGTMEGAAHESNGFFVHYDPQEAKTTQGTLVRGPSPGLNPETNKPIAGPTVALNKSVIIPNQTAPKPIINNDSKPEQGQ